MIKPHLEYLSAREQLAEEIASIVDAFDRDKETNDDLIESLQDAVCKHFPSTAQDAIQSCWIPKSEPTNSES